MKILKHGKVNRVITCNCGCEFEYKKKDIIYLNRDVNNDLAFIPSYVQCPDCRTLIKITQDFPKTP